MDEEPAGSHLKCVLLDHEDVSRTPVLALREWPSFALIFLTDEVQEEALSTRWMVLDSSAADIFSLRE